MKPSLLIFSALSNPPFRSIKLRPRRSDCVACSSTSKNLLDIGQVDYVQFCGGERPDWEFRGLQDGERGMRISAKVGVLQDYCPSLKLIGGGFDRL